MHPKWGGEAICGRHRLLLWPVSPFVAANRPFLIPSLGDALALLRAQSLDVRVDRIRRYESPFADFHAFKFASIDEIARERLADAEALSRFAIS